MVVLAHQILLHQLVILLRLFVGGLSGLLESMVLIMCVMVGIRPMLNVLAVLPRLVTNTVHSKAMELEVGQR